MRGKRMKNVVIVGGQGKWGQNYVKTLADFPDVSLKVATRDNWKRLIDGESDAVIVSTPPSSHVEIASYALSKGIPTMIEKPLALSLQEAQQLKQFDVPILVNHINLFSEAYESLRNYVKKDNITSITTYGLGNGPVRNYSALWDYAPHCFSMILDIVGMMPDEILATCRNDFNYDIDMKFAAFKTHSLVSNAFSCKKRGFWVNLDGISVGFSDNQRSETHEPPLKRALNVFLNHPEDRRFGLDLSLKVVKLLECCEKSLDTKSTVMVQ
jgi:predicted dehydrogenase